jgi:type VI protein secretion system component Hcp
MPSVHFLSAGAGIPDDVQGNTCAVMLMLNTKTNKWVNGDSRLRAVTNDRLKAAYPGVDIVGYEWGANRSGSQAAAQAHRVHPEPLIVYRTPDRATATLTQLLGSGDPLTIDIQMFKDSGRTASDNDAARFCWLQLSFGLVTVRKQQICLAPGKQLPLEMLELSYQSFTVEYKPQADVGTAGATSTGKLTFAHSS